jgi:hypothetical protein
MSITMSDISTCTTGATSPSCLPVVCPEWCTSTTGHAEEDHVEDQWHRGESSEVTLSRHDLVDYGGTFQMQYLSVQASSEEGPDSPHCVRLSIGDDQTEIKLTYGETLALRDALSHRAEEIDPPSRGGGRCLLSRLERVTFVLVEEGARLRLCPLLGDVGLVSCILVRDGFGYTDDDSDCAG